MHPNLGFPSSTGKHLAYVLGHKNKKCLLHKTDSKCKINLVNYMVHNALVDHCQKNQKTQNIEFNILNTKVN
jgi:hypothetical protein